MPANIVKEGQEDYWRRAKKLAAEQGHANDYAYIVGIFKRMAVNKAEREAEEYAKSLGGLSIHGAHRFARNPGQVATKQPDPHAMIQRQLDQMMTPRPLDRAPYGDHRQLPMLSAAAVVRDLGFTMGQERTLAHVINKAVQENRSEIRFRQSLNNDFLERAFNPELRRALMDRSVTLFRARTALGIAALAKSETVTIEKAQPRGGNYERRVPRADGKGFTYYYDKEKYEAREDAHVSGKDAANKYIHTALEKFVTKDVKGGCDIKDLTSLVTRYGPKEVAAVAKKCGYSFRDGRLFAKAKAKPERVLVRRLGFRGVDLRKGGTPIGGITPGGNRKVQGPKGPIYVPAVQAPPREKKREEPSKPKEHRVTWPARWKTAPAFRAQPVLSKEELYAKAEEGQKQFQGLMGALAKTPGFHDYKMPGSKDAFAADLQGAHPPPKKGDALVVVAPIKRGARAEQKVADKFGGDWSQLTDVIRGMVVVDQLSDVQTVVDRLHKLVGAKAAMPPKDRILKPTSGYRDVQLHLELENGMVAELQIQVSPMLHAKEIDKGHKLYEEMRVIKDKAKAAGRNYSSEEDQLLAKLEQESLQVYNSAWNEIIGK